MKIAVNTRLLIEGKLDGIGWFTYEIMKRITHNHPEHEFVFIFDRPYSRDFIFEKNVRALVVPPPARHPLLWWIYFGFTLPRALKKIKPDFFLSLDGYLPAQKELPMLDVIHDINFEHYPKMMPWLVRKYYRHYFPIFARKANRIATVSAFSKKDISETYHIPADKIDVVYNGVNPEFKPISDQEKENIREKYSGGQPYLLFVGSLHQRKNIVNMLKAFDRAKSQLDFPLNFLIVGSKMWWTKEMQHTLSNMKHRESVILTGRVEPQKELTLITAAASAFIYVPFYEGFGVPVLEAQMCGVPVIASETSSIPEVAGNAALFCKPSDVVAISDGIVKVLKDDELRSQVIKLGEENVKRFSWDKSADLLWQSLLKMRDETA